MKEFTQHRFVNGLRILLNIDMWEFTQKGLPEDEWPKFRENPHRWMIQASDFWAEALWEIIDERSR